MLVGGALTFGLPIPKVRAMFARGSKWAVVLMLVLVTGGQWFFLQSIAWVQMTVRFAQSETLGAALEKTFDGKHACKLCQFVKRGKAAEKQNERELSQLKMDFHHAAESCGLVPPRPIRHFTPFRVCNEARAELPALPPPRSFTLPV